MDKREIETKLKTCGDYVKMDYLSRCLKSGKLDLDTKKFVMVRLSGIYESRRMFFDAANLLLNAAEISATEQSRLNDYVKSGELFIRCGRDKEAETTFNKALSLCKDEKRKDIVKSAKIGAMIGQARVYLNKGKKRYALRLYESLLECDMDSEIKEKIKERLLEIYEQLGMVREYMLLKKDI